MPWPAGPPDRAGLLRPPGWWELLSAWACGGPSLYPLDPPSPVPVTRGGPGVFPPPALEAGAATRGSGCQVGGPFGMKAVSSSQGEGQ